MNKMKFRLKIMDLLERILSHLLGPYIDNEFYEEHVEKRINPEFKKKHKKRINPYFAKWGFKVDMLENDYFESCSGIKSELYVPFVIWKAFIYSYLNKDSWRFAYTDKNLFSRLLNLQNASRDSDVSLPESVVSCIGGFFFNEKYEPISKESCVDKLLNAEEALVIKPSVESHSGRGVIKIKQGGYNREEMNALIEKYGQNFIVQKLLQQHPDIAAFNRTSINSIRIVSYCDFKGRIKILYAVQRFGASGGFIDNASGGGCFCGIEKDGRYQRKGHRYGRIETFDIPVDVPLRVPCFDKIQACVCNLHKMLPQFKIVAWDVSLDPQEHVKIIEYNLSPGHELCQQTLGPIFEKEDLDEIMEHVSKAKRRISIKHIIIHPEKKENDFYF